MKPRDLALVALFTALTAVGAYIAIPLPFTQVPFTLQVLFVILAGIVLGKYKAFLSQLAYVFIGAIGVPVFAKGASGFAALFGPSGGYLFGFIAGAFVVGWLAEMNIKWHYGWYLIAGFAGILVIYVFGIIQLSLVVKVDLAKAFILGVAPFILFDIVKVFLAAVLAISLEQAGVKQLEY